MPAVGFPRGNVIMIAATDHRVRPLKFIKYIFIESNAVKWSAIVQCNKSSRCAIFDGLKNQKKKQIRYFYRGTIIIIK